jgi:hypothetical protein
MYHLVFRLLSVGFLYLCEVNCHLSILLKFFVCVTFSNYISSLCLQYWSKLCHCWYTASCYVTYTLSKFWLLVQCKSSYMINGAFNNYSANQEILCYHRNQRFVTVLTKNNRHLTVHHFNEAHITHRSFSKIFPFIPSLPKQFLCKRYFKPKFCNVSGFPGAS